MLVAGCALAQSGEPTKMEEAGRINARLAMEYLKREQLSVAKEKVDKALDENPKDVSVQLAAGLVYERLLKKREAEKHFRQAVKVAPDNPEAQNAYGAYLCRNDEYKKGQEMFLTAAANPLYRTPFVAYTNAGVCARSEGKPDVAERFLRQAVATGVDYPEAFAQLAGVLHERGNDLQARAFIERYLASAPAAPGVLLLGHEIETALKDDNAAAAYRDRLKKEFPDSEQARAVDKLDGRNPG